MRETLQCFFAAERARAGWRFWLLWVVATNLGFFPGLRFGQWVAEQLTLSMGTLLDSAVRATTTGLIYIVLVSVLQALVLARHSRARRGWLLASVPGFTVGIFLGVLLLDSPLPGLGLWPHGLLLGGIAGLVAGLPLWLALRPQLPVGWWWVPLNGLAWLVFFPGMVTGVALALLLGRAETSTGSAATP